MERTARARTPEIKIQREAISQISFSPHSSPRHGRYGNQLHSPHSSPRHSPHSSRGSTPERSTSPKHVKGTRAKFIRQNPRFINSPICNMDPAESGRSVAECLEWKKGGGGGSAPSSPRHNASVQGSSAGLDSTLHHDYRPPSPDTRPRPLQRFSPRKPSNIPIGNPTSQGREKISFIHQYDSRSESDQQPERGSLHGTFVWEPMAPPPPSSSPSSSSPAHQNSSTKR